METILVVDDEKNYTLVMHTLLTDAGFEVLTAQSGLEALDILEENDLDLVLTDMTMPMMDGIELLDRIKRDLPHLPVVMMTAYGTVEKAVEAMKKGAYDYITKPFKNEELMMIVRKALAMSRLQKENRALTAALKERYSVGGIIGKSKPMLEIYRLIEKVADTKANILITGESGTGKELIARAIHYHGPRGKGPFEAVNCAALAESILESELFGHEKGAFTDARATRKGLFEISAGGTVFLDEIGELSLNLQAKLLRVLQERTFKRVGGNETIAADVRIIAATNRELKQEVADGRFREDLFYRLNVVHVPVPPLRDRRDDIPLLTQHFIEKYGVEREGREKLRISPDALRHIYNYSWPGNIRELENAIERAIILCSDDLITPDDLPQEVAGAKPSEVPPIQLQEILTNGREKKKPAPEETEADLTEVDLDRLFPEDIGLNEALEAVEKKMIRRALEKAGQVQAHAADLLGIKKNVMQYKVKKYPPEELAAETEIDLDLDGAIPPDWDLNEVLEGVEKKILKRALDKSQGVQTQAAAELGITKRMMQYKMQKYNL